jgi:hypothetical protein
MFLVPMAISLAADYCLPAASLYLAEYAGGTMAAGFLTGLVRCYNESVFAPGPFGSIDPTTSLCERGGMCLVQLELF